MERKRTNKFILSISLLLMLVVVLVARSGLRSSAHIVLPPERALVAESGGEDGVGDGGVIRVEITPETVQYAIETLERREDYCRTATVEIIWSGGSAATQMEVTVSGNYTRVDGRLPGGQIRHGITNGTHSWVWYNNSTYWSVFLAGDISADDEQQIPTYEDILILPRESIVKAEYTKWEETPCIFVETELEGYVHRYWVSVDTGLLVAAERLTDENVIYRMSAVELPEEVPTTADFTLPDGTVLLQIKA